MERKAFKAVTAGLEILPVLGEFVIERDVMVPMPDGVNLAINIYRPGEAGKYPVIMCLTPFGKDQNIEESQELAYMSELGVENGHISVSELTTFEGPDPDFWVRHGYIVIYVDARGCHASEGTFDPMGMGNDYYHVIEWAGVQDWSNGKIGLSGVSALAQGQYRASCLKPPHLKAIIPWESFTDQYRDLNFQGGIPETFFWLRLMKKTLNLPDETFEQMTDAFRDPMKGVFLKNSAIPVEDIETPMLICASWSNKDCHSRGSFEAYRRCSSREKWLYNHGGLEWGRYYSKEALEVQKRFFDYYLKGLDNRWSSTPAVRIEVRETLDTCQVRHENEWPLSRTLYTKLYLDTANRNLTPDPLPDEGTVHYNPLSGGDASFAITWDEDTELTGYMVLKLWVCADGADDMDIFVGIKKFDALGNEIHFRGSPGWRGDVVARGQMRVSLRELDEALSTPYQPVQKFEKEKKLKPGEIVPVEIAILPSGTLFKKGESMRLYIQGHEIVVNPIIGYRQPRNKGTHIIYSGGKYDSYLCVPVIPKTGGDAYAKSNEYQYRS